MFSGVFALVLCFFFNDTATTEIYTLSLHDALPIFGRPMCAPIPCSHGWDIDTDQGAIMKQVQERPLTPSPEPAQTTQSVPRPLRPVALWKLNVLRVGYL